MEVKGLVLISLFLSLETECFGIGVNFCSGVTIKDYFDGSSKESALTLNGSSSAVAHLTAKYANAPSSCTCAVTSESTSLEKLHVKLSFSTRLTSLQTCHKRLHVFDHTGQAMHVFGCTSDYIEIDDDDVEDGIRFRLNLFDNPGATDSRVVDDLYLVYIVPEPGSVLTVRCYQPVSHLALSTSSVSYSSTSSSTASSSTTQTFVASESIDTSVVVGVVVGLGLLFLIFISCMLLYIARRRTRRDDSEKPDSPTSQQQSKYAVGRTLTNFYDKVKTNRPLPRIPASIRNIARWKRQHNAESGVYDSIKSNNNNGKYQLDKQMSQGSDCSYLEPATITSICESVASKDVNDFCPNLKSYPKNTLGENVHTLFVHQASDKKISAVKDAEHLELNNSTYIHPVSKKDESLHDSGYHSDKEASHGMYENTPAFHHTYMNTADAQKISNRANDPDTVAESHDPTYIDMCTRVDSIDSLAASDKQAPVNDVTNKEVLKAEDSTGYLKMSVSDVKKIKGLLKPKESLFPELIKFTPHERDEKDTAKMSEVNPIKDDTNSRSNDERNIKNKNIKYIK